MTQPTEPQESSELGGVAMTADATSDDTPKLASERRARSRRIFAADARFALQLLLRTYDPLAIMFAGWLAALCSEGTELNNYYSVAIAGAVLFIPAALSALDAYDYSNLIQPRAQIQRTLGTVVVAMMLFVQVGYFSKTSAHYSRVWTIDWFVLIAVFLLLARLLLLSQLRVLHRSAGLAEHIVVIGALHEVESLLGQLSQTKDDRALEIVGIFLTSGAVIPQRTLGRYPVLGGLDASVAFIRSHKVDQVILAMPHAEQAELQAAVQDLGHLPVDVSLYLVPVGVPVRGVSRRAGAALLDVHRRPLGGAKLLLKRLEDRVLSALMLLASAPLMLLMALAIKLDSRGPVFYRQLRTGFNGKRLYILKFRTMHHTPVPDGVLLQATRGDPRVTRIGRWLRSSSLDELPQLWNVLKGEMSLVGPRPHAVVHDEQFATQVDNYFARHKVLPGMTGWAQVNGLRGEVRTALEIDRRVEYDLFYIENWSLWLDIKILLRTAFIVIFSKNAY